MALNINTKLTNNLDGYLLDAKNVKGTYVVVADYSELSNLPASCVVVGSLAYCQSDYSTHEAGFYQYTGSGWEVADLGGGGVATLMTSVTYSQFVSAIQGGTLIPGMVYRITDYVTKIHGVYDLSLIGQQGAYLPYATSAEHPFDLLVTATGTNTYNENVKAMLHTGDSYFVDNNLSAWELKWTHLNDATKYSWADSTNGKGVITWMKDEFGNEAWYDFKNVMNLQFALERIDDTSLTGKTFEYNEQVANNPAVFNYYEDYIGYYLQDGTFITRSNHLSLNIEPGTTIPYTKQLNRYGGLMDVFEVLQGEGVGGNLQFKAPSSNGINTILFILAFSDVSKDTLESTYDWTYLLALLSNMSGMTIDLPTLAYLLGTTTADLSSMTGMDVIQQILYGDFYYTFDFVEINTTAHKDLSLDGSKCQENKIEHCADALTTFLSESLDDFNNVIYNGLNVVTFENNSYKPNDICYCIDNKIGVNCFLNVLGNFASNNVFAYGSLGNKCGNSFSNNVLKSNCQMNFFEDGFQRNILGVMGNSNVFGSSCNDNIFGNTFINNIFGSACSSNKFGDGCQGNFIGDSYNSNEVGYGFSSNTIGDAFTNNKFGNLCVSNYFGDYCQSNVFGNYCQSNHLGNNSIYNIFGSSSSNNSGVSGFKYNTFGIECYNNTFGTNCEHNTFGKNCRDNTFQGYFYYNNFGDAFSYNTFSNNSSQNNNFGTNCNHNTFGVIVRCSFGSDFGYNSMSSTYYDNIFGNHCVYNIIDGCSSCIFETEICYIDLQSINSSSLNYIKICAGVKGSSSNNKKVIQAYGGQAIYQEYKVDGSREVLV